MCWSVPTQTQTTTTTTTATSVKFPPTERPTASSPKEDTRSTTQTSEPAHPPPTSSIRKNVDVNVNVDVDVTNLLVLGVCAFGICSCYLCYGYLHELLSTQTSHNHKETKMTSFLILTQSVTNTIAAFVWTRATSTTSKSATATKLTDRLNHRLLFLTAFCYSMAMSATNESLRYVSYPTATLAKSSKLIPTMAVGYFVERKSYRKQEWMGALLLTVGIVAFHWSRHVSQQQTTDSRWGVALLVTSLAMDGLLGSCQNLLKESSSPLQSKLPSKQQSEQPPWKGTFGGKTLSIPTSDSTCSNNSSTPSSNASNQARIRTYRPPTAIETMLYVNLYSLLWIGPAAWWSGQCTHAFRFARNWRLIAQLNLCAVLGQAFIFTTIQRFSPLMCTTLTTTRKFGTILLSVYRFDHQFSTVQWTCVVMVFSGLYLQIVSKVMVMRRHPKTE